MNAARIRALIVVGVLMVGSLTLTFLAVHRDTQSAANYLSTCGDKAVPVITSPLPAANQITLKVWNGSQVPGLAQSVAEEFRYRGFNVEKVGAHDDKPAINGVAAIYYGPKTVAAAQVVRAEFLMTDPSEVNEMHFSIKDMSTDVDVVLGKSFRQLGAHTEVNQAIAALGVPNPPPGTCAKSS